MGINIEKDNDMNDIPLASAQIIWDADDQGLPPAKVVNIPGDDDRRYSKSWGACNADFNSADDAEKVRLLLLQFNQMTAIDGIDGKQLHDVFMAIPEYRRALADFGSIDPALA